MLDYVRFDASRVTSMAGWIEIEINLLVILNNFIKATLMYFTMCIGLDCAQKLFYSIRITYDRNSLRCWVRIIMFCDM